MEFTQFLSAADANRAVRTVTMLRRHSTQPLVLTGGLAVELHHVQRTLPAIERPLNDVDFLVDRFDEIPTTLSADLLFRHVHPHDPPAKTLLQCVDPQTGIRIDIFHACGGTTSRAGVIELCGANLRLISIEDLVARTARLCMNLAANEPLPRKHARDFLRLLPLADSDGVESAWQDHRKANHPGSFAAAAILLQHLIHARTDLQVVPLYSRDVYVTCSRCEPTGAFPLADAAHVLSLLGYC